MTTLCPWTGCSHLCLSERHHINCVSFKPQEQMVLALFLGVLLSASVMWSGHLWKSFKSTIFKTPPPRRRRRMSTKSPWSINVFLSNIIFCKQCTWLPLVSDNYCKVTSGTNWRHSIDLRSLVSRMIAVPTGSAEEHWKQLGAALSSPFFTLWFCIWQSRGDLSLWRSGPHSF